MRLGGCSLRCAGLCLLSLRAGSPPRHAKRVSETPAMLASGKALKSCPVTCRRGCGIKVPDKNQEWCGERCGIPPFRKERERMGHPRDGKGKKKQERWASCPPN